MTVAVTEHPPTQLAPPGAAGVLYLIDISGYVFRAFYALPPLTSSKGEPTGALYGLTSMVLKLVREQKPDMLAVVMDSKGPSFRSEVYADYKANRPAAPPDLARQMAQVRSVADAYAIPCYAREGTEADDLIASLTRIARARGHQVVIVSADKDLLQLVGEGVVMLDTMRNKTFGPPETLEKLGVWPAQVGDFLALTGDSSDNIPGVPSVGPKTAVELLREHGTLDGIYQHLDEIKKKAVQQKLRDHRELAYLSKKLVTLKDDLELPFEEEKLRYGGWDEAALRRFYQDLGFTRLLAELDKGKESAPRSPSAPPAATPRVASLGVATLAGPVGVVCDATSLAELAEILSAEPKIGLASLVGREDPIRGELVGVAFACSRGAYYVPLGHRYLGCPAQLTANAFVTALRGPLESEALAKVSADVKRDTIALAELGITLRGASFDTMLASYLIDPDLRGHGLVEIGLRREHEVPGYEGTAGKGKNERPLSELTFDEVLTYASAQTRGPLAFMPVLEAELKEAKVEALLHDLELPLARVLARVERTGIRCDAEKLRALSLKVERDLATLEKRCHELAGHEFNVNSPRQLETILFDELALPVIEKTKTARSTNHEVLEELSLHHELPATILEHRQLAKLKGTYLDALPREILPRTGRIHTRFEQAVAATGRLSSNEPNLQNIPIRSEVGRAIRDAFVPDEGFHILAADYSQIELRVLAHLSRDEALLEAFQTDADVHNLTAQALFGVPKGAVTREMRAAAKTVNFAVIYGQTQFALARNLRISRGEAQAHIKAFFNRYHGVRRYLDELVAEARRTGEVRTLLGRRRLVRDINAKNHQVRSGAERIAQNSPIQGSAADIMKLAMVRVATRLEQERMQSRMLLTVHDELVFEAPDAERERLEALVREAMEGAVKLDVPLAVGLGWGKSWGEAH